MGPIVLIGAGLVTLGVIVFAMGHRQAVHTTPLVQVLPSYKADASNIKNAINTVNVLSAKMNTEPEINIGPSYPGGPYW